MTKQQLNTQQINTFNHYFYAEVVTTQSISASTSTDIVYNSGVVDPNSNYNSSTGVYTAPRAGFYHFSARKSMAAYGGNTRHFMSLIKNGSTEIVRLADVTLGAQSSRPILGGSTNVYLAAGDTVKIQIWIAGATTIGDSAGQSNNFSGFRVQ